jgi:5-methylcytosine-specific restriction enzyme subunit McrC
MVVVRPKVPIAALLQLVGLAYRLRRLPSPRDSTLLAKADPLDWLTLLILAEVELLLSSGLRRGYVERIGALAFLRGRLLLSDYASTLRSPGTLKCRYSAFIDDTLENRIVKGTLEFLSTCTVHPEIRRRTLEAIRMMGSVTLIRPTLAHLSRVRMTRLNKNYECVLRLCEVYLSGAGVAADPGDIAAPSFFVPMHQVFEQAVANAIMDGLEPGTVLYQQPYSRTIRYVAGNPALQITIRPDVVVKRSARKPMMLIDGEAAEHLLVVDTKYQEPIISGRFGRAFRSDSIYQIVSYGHALGCPGIVLYPRVDEDVDVTYRLGSTTFRLLTVNLMEPDLRGIYAVVNLIKNSLKAPIAA